MAKIVKLENKNSADTAAEKIQPQDFAEDEEEYERYIPVEQSIIESLKQVREMRAGRMPEKNWREFFRELREEDEAEERSKVNEKRRINA
ncbi:MAG: hypothetical protein IJU91_09880 [Selenomonadaceae bacterium]|nr:hypothetical protein [Selenomonadaceae bacterium]